jgi:hypothetical protein
MNTNRTQKGSINEQQQSIIKGCQGTPTKNNKEVMQQKRMQLKSKQ